MRIPTEMPQRRRLSRGRIGLIVTVGVLFALFLSLRGLAGFWTDWMWFDSLGLSSVFTGVLGAKIALGVKKAPRNFVKGFIPGDALKRA